MTTSHLLQRIVVPLDGTLAAEAILPELRRILRRADSELILVRAEFPLVAEPFPGAVVAGAAEEARAYLRRVAERLRDEGVGARVRAETGPAVDAILKVVREEEATLIAMTTRARTGAARVVLGSVAEEVIRRSPVPVMAIRTLLAESGAPLGTGERQPFRTILLPLDRSDRALRALAPAADLCRLFGARLMLLHVLSPGEDPAAAEAHLRAVETKAAFHSVAVTSLLQTGKPVEEILGVARFHDADLIAMATHGRRGLARLATGSVTEEVLRRAYVPVLIVRSADAPAAEGRESVA